MRFSRTRLTMMACIGGLLLFSGSVWGHGVNLHAHVEGNQLRGQMAYADGTPVADRPIRAFGPDGAVLQEARTDGEGRFAMPVEHPVRHRLVGEAGEGHRGLYTVPESEIAAALPAPGGGKPENPAGASTVPGGAGSFNQDVLESAIARQLGPLREALHRHESRVRLRDVIGGIGYVFGLFGIVVLFKRRQPAAPPESRD